jgi:regulator of replication initiation timing
MFNNKIIFSSLLTSLILVSHVSAKDYYYENEKMNLLKTGMDTDTKNSSLGDISYETRQYISGETNRLMNEKVKTVIPVLIKDEINRYNETLKRQTNDMVMSAVNTSESSTNTKIADLNKQLSDLKTKTDYLEKMQEKQASQINDYQKLKAKLAKKEADTKKAEKKAKKKKQKLESEKKSKSDYENTPIGDNTPQQQEPTTSKPKETVVEDLGI